MRYLKTLALIVALMVVCFAAVGCNTVEGFGEDLSNLGEAIEDAAD